MINEGNIFKISSEDFNKSTPATEVANESERFLVGKLSSPDLDERVNAGELLSYYSSWEEIIIDKDEEELKQELMAKYDFVALMKRSDGERVFWVAHTS